MLEIPWLILQRSLAMSFKRKILPESLSQGTDLTKDLIGIGFRLKGKGNLNPNIENTIVAASIEGIAGDLRVLSILVDWMDVHYQRVNTDRLYRMLLKLGGKKVLPFWAAIAKWKCTDRRYKRIEELYKGRRIDLLTSGTEFHIQRNGEDLRFENTCLRVPNKAGLRTRPSDVLKPRELANKHLTYYYRLLIGPTYRADMWAQLEIDSDLSLTELAHRTYGSFATAWQVDKEWKILKDAA